MNQSSTSRQDPGIFNATHLKVMAIIAMFIDHYAWAFVPLDSVQGQLMHGVGRFTFPIMAFFIAEGFFYTKNFKRYLSRMGVFALISHFAFQYFQFGRIPLFSPQPQDTFLSFTYTGVLYTFSLGLIALWIFKKWEGPTYAKRILILLISVLATPGDYMFYAPLLIVMFGMHHGDLTEQLKSGLFVIAFLVISTLQASWRDSIFMIATFIPLLFLRYYNGEQGAGKHPLIKYSFYIFYPLHLFIIAFVRYEMLNLAPLF